MAVAANDDIRMLERLRTALNVAGVGAWEWDLHSGEAWWSDHIYAILGRPRAEFPTSLAAFLECVVEQDREALLGVMSAVMRGGDVHAFACRILRPDGTLRACRGQMSAVLDDAGRCRRILGVLRNTTLEDAARVLPDGTVLRALRDQRKELATLVDTSPSPLLLVDAAQRILRVNPATERMFGWPGGQLLSRDLKTLFLEPGEVLDVLLVSATARGPEERVTRAVTAISHSGRPIRVEMTVAAVTTTEGARFAVTLAEGAQSVGAVA